MIEQASWIWAADQTATKDIHAYVRYVKRVTKPIRTATIEITAGDHYKLYCGGARIGEGPCPATPAQYYYDSYPLQAPAAGELFCLAVHAYSIGDAAMVTCQNQGVPGVLFAVEILYEDGDTERILSSSQCKSCTPPRYYQDPIRYDEARISKWGGFEEVCLSEREIGDFFHPEYDDSTWENANVVEHAKAVYGNLIPREIPRLAVGIAWPDSVLQIEPYLGCIFHPERAMTDSEEFAEIRADVPQSYPSVVYDFGHQVVGSPVFDVHGAAGASMRVLYGESLDMMRMDTLVMNGTRQEYRPYQRRAFRFMKLTFNNSIDCIRLYRVRIETVRYAYVQQGSFICSDDQLNHIHQISLETVRQNAQDHFEDCVMREKMQWLADARVMSMVAYWNFQDARLSKKAIQQFFRIQMPDGMIPSAGPQAMNARHVDFCLHFVLMLYEYSLHTGDLSVAAAHWEQLQRLMAYFEQMEDEDGLLNMDRNKTAEVFLDWARIDKRQRIALINVMYVDGLRKVAWLMDELGKSGSASVRTKAELLSEANSLSFWNQEARLLCDCAGEFGRSDCYSEQSNLGAVTYRGVRQELLDQMLDTMADGSFPENMEVIKGAFFLSHALQGLFDQGLDELALDRMKQFWGGMIDRGATTWWETFDIRSPSSSIPDLFSSNSATSFIPYIPCSHSHGWGAGPAYLLPRYVLGIEPVAPGFKKIRFRPHTGGLLWARGAVPTPYGLIHVAWKRDENGEVTTSIVLPEGIEQVEGEHETL